MSSETYEYLYDNAGPVIKNQVSNALGRPTVKTRQAMLKDPAVEYWLSCTQEFAKNQRVHDSFDTRLENWMHKLVSFGVRENDDLRLQKVSAEVLNHIIKNAGNEKFFDSISNVIAASYLSYMGCEDDIVLQIITQRIDAVYGFVKNKDYDIYADKKDYPAVPKARDRYPLVKPELYAGNIWRLPTVHDLFAFANLPQKIQRDAELKNKIDAIVGYILTDEYQKLPWGYGLMLVPPRTYYSMGWSVKLSRYFKTDENYKIDPILWETELMSHFEAARSSEWFIKRIEFLKSYCSGGIYEFPSNYLTEIKDKYYVGGGHMGLCENRRKKDWRQIESTAWMMRILNNIVD